MYDPAIEDKIEFNRHEHVQVDRNITSVSNQEQNRATRNNNLEPSY